MDEHGTPAKATAGINSEKASSEPQNLMKEEERSLSPSSEGKPPPPKPDDEDGWEYITGVKLFLVIGLVTLACFIMLLDTSIVSTVSQISTISVS